MSTASAYGWAPEWRVGYNAALAAAALLQERTPPDHQSPIRFEVAWRLGDESHCVAAIARPGTSRPAWLPVQLNLPLGEPGESVSVPVMYCRDIGNLNQAVIHRLSFVQWTIEWRKAAGRGCSNVIALTADGLVTIFRDQPSYLPRPSDNRRCDAALALQACREYYDGRPVELQPRYGYLIGHPESPADYQVALCFPSGTPSAFVDYPSYPVSADSQISHRAPVRVLHYQVPPDELAAAVALAPQLKQCLPADVDGYIAISGDTDDGLTHHLAVIVTGSVAHRLPDELDGLRVKMAPASSPIEFGGSFSQL